MDSITKQISAREASIMLMVLRQHDGSSLCPDLSFIQRCKISEMFDKLRKILAIIAEQSIDKDCEYVNSKNVDMVLVEYLKLSDKK